MLKNVSIDFHIELFFQLIFRLNFKTSWILKTVCVDQIVCNLSHRSPNTSNNFSIVSLRYPLHSFLNLRFSIAVTQVRLACHPVLHIRLHHLQTMWNVHDLRLSLLCVSKILIQLRQKLLAKATNIPFRGIRHNYGDIFRFHDCTFGPIICFRQF